MTNGNGQVMLILDYYPMVICYTESVGKNVKHSILLYDVITIKVISSWYMSQGLGVLFLRPVIGE